MLHGRSKVSYGKEVSLNFRTELRKTQRKRKLGTGTF